MCQITGQLRPKSAELADVFRQHGDAYIAQHGVSTTQHKAINAITRCRTAILGGHISTCDHCGRESIAYNSCRSRHCPKCQSTNKLLWLEKRKAEVLPVHYFHVVFTLPHELNLLASYNPSILYNLLFKVAWATIDTLGHDPKRLGGMMGMMGFLHTWGQTGTHHIHLHCLVPGGALCVDNQEFTWRSCKSGYLFPVKVMSKLFGKFFLTALQAAYQCNELTFKGAIAELSAPAKFTAFIAQLRKKTWNVYAKEPFHGAKGGLEYLARYMNKTAITNDRILSVVQNKVSFKWRDYADHNRQKIMTLEAHEFIRRFLTHVLPTGFMRIRSFGFLANTCKAKYLGILSTLLVAGLTEANNPTTKEGLPTKAVLLLTLKGIDITLCKHCKQGRLQVIQTLPNLVKSSLPYIDPS